MRLLDQYRRSFTEAYEIVVGKIRNELGLEPTGRPAKSTTSISDKLRRESIRLTQIQDIAGCRLIVPDIRNQESVVQSLSGLFEHYTVIDRRQRPSHGYRAVHVVVNYGGKLIEIQVRTSMQHLWAELSEKLSDVKDPAIKYGGGDETSRELLRMTSEMVAISELAEAQVTSLMAEVSLHTDLPEGLKQEIDGIKERYSSQIQESYEILRGVINYAQKLKGEKDALPD